MADYIKLDYYYSFNELSKLYLTMPATIAKAFIPRILGNVTVSQIRDAFAAKQIGKVKNIDMHRRKNEKNNQYSFAFIELALYDTKEATDLCEDILDNGSSKVFYDRKNYWEVKAFLPKSERVAASPKEPEPQEQKAGPAVVQNKEDEDIRSMCITPVSPDLAWQRMAMHSELLHSHHTREVEQSTCRNCGDGSNPECATSIFWKNYSFCSGRCQWEMESDIRKSWRKYHQKQQAISTTSKFIAMFERIQEEAAEEMKNIHSFCYELIKRPSVFTKEDREEMTRDYEALQKEMAIA
jgi:hypothetical protein